MFGAVSLTTAASCNAHHSPLNCLTHLAISLVIHVVNFSADSRYLHRYELYKHDILKPHKYGGHEQVKLFATSDRYVGYQSHQLISSDVSVGLALQSNKTGQVHVMYQRSQMSM